MIPLDWLSGKKTEAVCASSHLRLYGAEGEKAAGRQEGGEQADQESAMLYGWYCGRGPHATYRCCCCCPGPACVKVTAACGERRGAEDFQDRVHARNLEHFKQRGVARLLDVVRKPRMGPMRHAWEERGARLSPRSLRMIRSAPRARGRCRWREWGSVVAPGASSASRAVTS